MNIFKRTEEKIDDFFMKSMDYDKKEGIIFSSIFFFLILLPLIIGLIFSALLAKISIIYLLISFVLCLILIDADDWVGYIIVIFLLPYIFLLMRIDKIFLKFIPYKGDDPMLIRSYKVRYLKRKAKINRLKFWK